MGCKPSGAFKVSLQLARGQLGYVGHVRHSMNITHILKNLFCHWIGDHKSIFDQLFDKCSQFYLLLCKV